MSDSGDVMTYEQFRIGDGDLFAETALELREEARRLFERTGERMFISRSTILGRMRQKKLASYDAYRRWATSERKTLRERRETAKF